MASTSGEMRAVRHSALELLRPPEQQRAVITEERHDAVTRAVLTNPLDDPYNRAAKRIFDIVLSSILILLTSPIMAIAWLCIKFESRGPALHTRLDDGSPVFRIGRDGMPFPYCKFRSMRHGTHSLRYTALAERNTRSGPLVKIDNDPRVTRVGRFIRKWHVDELPEFFMVLRGDMSIVGPRPHLPEEVERYAPHHRKVLCVKPGITGLTQIMGGSRLRYCEEIAYDHEYIRKWSLWRDLLIVIRTPFAIVSQRGDD